MYVRRVSLPGKYRKLGCKALTLGELPSQTKLVEEGGEAQQEVLLQKGSTTLIRAMIKRVFWVLNEAMSLAHSEIARKVMRS